MVRSSHRRYGARFQNRTNQKFRNKDDLDINACVPVLVELLKEKDSEIVKLRKEIDEVRNFEINFTANDQKKELY